MLMLILEQNQKYLVQTLAQDCGAKGLCKQDEKN